jgi:pimeloyl-ACP methyl ester carboxylesterase
MTDRVQPATLVLLPGLDGTDVFFRPLLEALPPWVTPVVVRYPPEGANDYAHLLDVAAEAVRGLGDYWLLGWSFSGPLALELARQHGQRIRGVILCASFVRAPYPLLRWCRFAAVGAVLWSIRVARRVPVFLSARRRPAWRDKSETWSSVSAGTMARRVRALLSVDATETLRCCEIPVVYLASSRDVIVPRRNAEEIVRHKPTTRLVVIDGPHMALYTNPQEAADAICQVLRTTPVIM